MKNLENEKNNQLIILKHQMESLNKQGYSMEIMLNKMIETDEKIDKNNERMDEVEMVVEDALEKIQIDYEQQKRIQSIVNVKANEFTELNYSDGMPDSVPEKFHNDLFKKKKGRYIRRLYARLKTHFNVVRYTALRRADFKIAEDFLENINFDMISPEEVEDLKSWNIPGLFDEDVS